MVISARRGSPAGPVVRRAGRWFPASTSNRGSGHRRRADAPPFPRRSTRECRRGGSPRGVPRRRRAAADPRTCLVGREGPARPGSTPYSTRPNAGTPAIRIPGRRRYTRTQRSDRSRGPRWPLALLVGAGQSARRGCPLSSGSLVRATLLVASAGSRRRRHRGATAEQQGGRPWCGRRSDMDDDRQRGSTTGLGSTVEPWLSRVTPM